MLNRNSIHKKFLFDAHKQSLKFLGYTYPNPSVGCIIVDFKKNKKGIVVSRGSTGKLGRPHAEEEALKNLKKISKNMTMYLTFEPCNHKSKYTSCVEMIIKSGLKNIFIAAEDPDLRTKFKSLNKLIKNNINVNFGLTKNITYLNNRFFYINKKFNRSYIQYKLAVSKDLKIAKSNYDSKWISNKLSRKYSHSLRYVSDAILTTYNTVKYDNPKLTIRFGKKDLYKNTIIILDSKLDININSYLIKSSKKEELLYLLCLMI